MSSFTGTIAGTARNVKTYEGVVKFALPYRQKENNNWVDKWANVVLFGKLADRFKEHGGDKCIVAVSGDISLNVYQKNDGSTSATVEILASRLDILQKVGQPQQTPAQSPRPQPNRAHASQKTQPNRQPTNAPPDDFDDDSVPF